jgi:hypothetical protein
MRVPTAIGDWIEIVFEDTQMRCNSGIKLLETSLHHLWWKAPLLEEFFTDLGFSANNK